MKRLGVLLLPPGWDARPSQSYPQHICWYSFVHLDEEKHCESEVPCLRTQHNDPSMGGMVRYLGQFYRLSWWYKLATVKNFWSWRFDRRPFVRANIEILGCVCFICKKMVVSLIITLLLVSDTSSPASYYLIGISFFRKGSGGNGGISVLIRS